MLGTLISSADIGALLAAADPGMSFVKIVGWTLCIVGFVVFAIGAMWVIGARQQDDDEGILSRIFISHLLYALRHLEETWIGLALGAGGLGMIGLGAYLAK